MIQRTLAMAGRLGWVCAAGALIGLATSAIAQGGALPKATSRDGQHDFDFEIGRWTIHLKRMLHPLSGTAEWAEFDGTSVTRPLWDGRADIEEFETANGTDRVEGMTLRLYDPKAHQWSLYWASGKTGQMGLPATVGEFKDGVGEFYDQEPINGRQILVRYQWSRITANSAHFEQAYSDDGGKTWEVNWITDQTRVKE
jgi:hypothetical protein